MIYKILLFFLVLHIQENYAMSIFLTHEHFVSTAVVFQRLAKLKPKIQSPLQASSRIDSEMQAVHDIQDFATFMGAFQGITVKERECKENRETLKNRVIKSKGPMLGLFDLVFSYVDDIGCIDIPFSTLLPKDFSSSSSLRSHDLTACLINKDGSFIGSYYFKNHGENAHSENVVQKYDPIKKKWSIIYQDGITRVYNGAFTSIQVFNNDRFVVNECHDGKPIVKIIDPQDSHEQIQAEIEPPINRMCDILVCPPNRLVVGYHAGEIHAYDTSDLKIIQEKAINCSIKEREERGEHVKLVSLADGFITATPHTINRWEIKPDNQMSHCAELTFPNALIENCAAWQDGVVCLVHDRKNEPLHEKLVFLNKALNCEATKPVVTFVHFHEMDTVVQYDKEKKIGIFGSVFHEYTKQEVESMNRILHRKKMSKARMQLPAFGRYKCIIGSQNPNIDFGITSNDPNGYKFNGKHLAAQLFFRMKPRIKKLCQAYVKEKI